MQTKDENKEHIIYQLARLYKELDEQDIVLALCGQFAHTEVLHRPISLYHLYIYIHSLCVGGQF